ncbi:hypothetical protein EV174_000846 [Coemansia sp. RSA 2320]|nr:hypothetical protein EV174_000846 [Coemansia sp. RSA 2320]
MTGVKGQLDDLAKEVAAMPWMPGSTPEPPRTGDTAVATGTATGSRSNRAPTSNASLDDSGGSRNWLRRQLLDQIGTAQAQLSQKIDEARAALGDAVQGILPDQLQRPWINACAQLSLDPEVHPELLQSASVRIGDGICGQEHDFRQKRAERMRKDFAEFIGVAAATVDTRDIPVIGVAGSGGGFRAMVSTIGACRAMHQAGLAQCVMYDAAVSGSSWAIGALHTYGNGNPYKVLDSIRLSMQTSMFSTTNILAFVRENDGIAQRVFVDMATRYLVAAAEGENVLETSNHSTVDSGEDAITKRQQEGSALSKTLAEAVQWSSQTAESVLPQNPRPLCPDRPAAAPAPAPATIDELLQIAKSSQQSISVPPLSIVELYGALLFKRLIVQHVAGENRRARLVLEPRWTKLSAQRTSVDRGLSPMPIYTAVRHFVGSDDNNAEQAAKDHKYQWFEFNPYEVGSIDHKAWIPSWAFGRPMVNGKEKFRVGEVHFGSILGTVASAFCASVNAMAMEVYLAVPAGLRSAIMDPLLDRYEQDTATSHLIPPYTLYNPFYRTENKHGRQEPNMAELESAPLLSLMDAGLENNLPFAPLLRPERGVDVIICLDASANIDLMPWFARAEQWAVDHGVRRWPWGARPWASDPLRPTKAEVEMTSTTLSSTKQASERIERRIKDGNMRCVIFEDPVAPSPFAKQREIGPAPITVMYLPLLKNERFRQPCFDPETADFCATFNDRWTVEQVDLLADLTTFNFGQELARIRQAVKRAYERKRAFRLYTEQQ